MFVLKLEARRIPMKVLESDNEGRMKDEVKVHEDCFTETKQNVFLSFWRSG